MLGTVNIILLVLLIYDTQWNKVETRLLEIKSLGKGNPPAGYYGNQTTDFHKVWLEL